MIRFVTGLPGSGKSHTIRTLLTDALSRGMDCVLLVPEQQAVLWERDLAAHLPPSAWLKLELTNFTRLANTVFRLYGGLTRPKQPIRNAPSLPPDLRTFPSSMRHMRRFCTRNTATGRM